MEMTASHAPGIDLVELVETLSLHRDVPALPSDPFRLVLWENMGALIDDARRAALFAEFGEKVGFAPGRIVTADADLLLSIARKGGMRPEVRVERWQECAALVLEHCGGDLAATLRALPLPKA